MKRLLSALTILLILAGVAASAYAGIIVPPMSPNKTFGRINVFGDSYLVGSGATNPASQSAVALISKATPAAPLFSGAQAGQTADQISFNAFHYFSGFPNIPSVTWIDAGANDGPCGTSAACLFNFSAEMNGTEAWLSIPYSFRQMGSVATKSGTWTTDNSFPSYNPGSVAPDGIYIASPGTPISSVANGATLTFSIPSSASSVVGITYQITNSGTGTFTLSVDGTLVTDACSGTTTFTSAPCGALTINQVTTAFRQQFSVTPNQTHTVIVTKTNTGKSDVLSIDWIPPSSTVNLNTVFVMGPDAVFSNASTYNSASKTVVTALSGAGLPIYFVDLINGTPGVNATTDIATSATSTCDGSTLANHPNSQCGYLHMAQTFYNAEFASGVVFSGPPLSANLDTSAFSLSVVNQPAQDITFRQSAISGAALYTPTTTGLYCIDYEAALSTAGTVSSILGGTTGFSVTYLDGADFVTRTLTLPEFNQSGTSLTVSSGNTTNTTAATLNGRGCVYVNGGSAITYSFGYTSVGATAMQYQIHARVMKSY